MDYRVCPIIEAIEISNYRVCPIIEAIEISNYRVCPIIEAIEISNYRVCPIIEAIEISNLHLAPLWPDLVVVLRTKLWCCFVAVRFEFPIWGDIVVSEISLEMIVFVSTIISNLETIIITFSF